MWRFWVAAVEQTKILYVNDHETYDSLLKMWPCRGFDRYLCTPTLEVSLLWLDEHTWRWKSQLEWSIQYWHIHHGWLLVACFHHSKTLIASQVMSKLSRFYAPSIPQASKWTCRWHGWLVWWHMFQHDLIRANLIWPHPLSQKPPSLSFRFRD